MASASKVSVSLEIDGDGVALIKFSNPPVNALSTTLLYSLKEKFEEASRHNGVKAIVLFGESGKFSGGFDIAQFIDVQRTGDTSQLGRVSIDIMINAIEGSMKPSVAAIEGLALGGGLELTMACNARVAAPKAQLGLPELTLGIIPGFGGTQRLPRLVGLTKAIEMMLLSKPVSSDEAKKLGLVDDVVPSGKLLMVAKNWALDIAEGHRPRIISLHRTDKLPTLQEARGILRLARAQAKKVTPKVPHPHLCLDAIEEGIVSGGFAGSLKEEEIFNKLVLSETGKALVHIFFAQRATTKVPGVSDIGLRPRPLKTVAVVGGGLMGSGIATALVLSDIHVILKEVNAEYLQQGLARIKANLESRFKKGGLSRENYEKSMSLVEGTLNYEAFREVDLVIEAVIENVPLKQQIFVDLEKFCPPHCILATNTSTIDLNVIGSKTHSQDRIIGAHFFSPAHVMPLFEIIRSSKTAPQAIVDLLNLAKMIKKVPVVVGNCTGFAVNRMFFPYTHSAHMLADLGVDVYRIDQVITDFGMPMGPFRLADLVGYEVGLMVAAEMVRAYPDRTYRSQLIPLLMKANRFGEKNGKGIYLYDEKRKGRQDPDFQQFAEGSRRLANIMPNGKPLVISDEEIVERLFFPVINEACRILGEGIVVRASDLDISSVLGFGFPAYRGGVVFWGDQKGAGYICDKLRKWSETHGSFYTPCSILEDKAARGLSLEAPVNTTKSRL